MKTIKQLADELGVSRQAIQYHYNRLSDKDKQKDAKGRNVVNERSESIIRSKVLNDDKAKSKDSAKGSEQSFAHDDSDLIVELKARIEFLEHYSNMQIASKDKQIESKDKQIDELNRFVDQSQQLQLSLQNMLENKTKQLELKEIELEQAQAKKWWQFWK